MLYSQMHFYCTEVQSGAESLYSRHLTADCATWYSLSSGLTLLLHVPITESGVQVIQLIMYKNKRRIAHNLLWAV